MAAGADDKPSNGTLKRAIASWRRRADILPSNRMYGMLRIVQKSYEKRLYLPHTLLFLGLLRSSFQVSKARQCELIHERTLSRNDVNCEKTSDFSVSGVSCSRWISSSILAEEPERRSSMSSSSSSS